MTDAREWRLWIVAALAGVYVLAWTQIAPRPAVSPPAGWRIVERAETVAPAPSRPVRIRTRSS